MERNYIVIVWNYNGKTSTYYLEFEGDYAIKHLQFSKEYVLLLDDVHPHIGDDWITDGTLSSMDLDNTDHENIICRSITADKFYSLWDYMKGHYGYGRTILQSH